MDAGRLFQRDRSSRVLALAVPGNAELLHAASQRVGVHPEHRGPFHHPGGEIEGSDDVLAFDFGETLPSSSAVNSALTIMANALRVANEVRRQLVA